MIKIISTIWVCNVSNTLLWVYNICMFDCNRIHSSFNSNLIYDQLCLSLNQIVPCNSEFQTTIRWACYRCNRNLVCYFNRFPCLFIEFIDHKISIRCSIYQTLIISCVTYCSNSTSWLSFFHKNCRILFKLSTFTKSTIGPKLRFPISSLESYCKFTWILGKSDTWVTVINGGKNKSVNFLISDSIVKIDCIMRRKCDIFLVRWILNV